LIAFVAENADGSRTLSKCHNIAHKANLRSNAVTQLMARTHSTGSASRPFCVGVREEVKTAEMEIQSAAIAGESHTRRPSQSQLAQPYLQTKSACRQFPDRGVEQEAEGVEKGEKVVANPSRMRSSREPFSSRAAGSVSPRPSQPEPKCNDVIAGVLAGHCWFPMQPEIKFMGSKL
jgi:hypothetical protein